MPCLRRTFRLLPIGLVFAASLASADSRTASENSSVAITGFRPVSIANESRQVALSRSAGWQQFNDHFGRWTAIWNEQTGTPHRAFGPGIALRGYSDNPASAGASVKGFVASHPEVFGPNPTLETRSVERHRNAWYLRYRQTVGGVPVLFSDWEFRLSTAGRLTVFGADARPTVTDIETTPRLGLASAREAAKSGLVFDPTTDWIEQGGDLYLLPVGSDYRLVYDVRVHTRTPRGNWITLVDAESGEVLWRRNRVRHANISGMVWGRAHPKLPTDALVTYGYPDLYVTVGATQTDTDVNGNYSVLCSGTSAVAAQLKGQYARVERLDLIANAAFSANTSCPGSRNILWDQSNSIDAERDAYYYASVAHAYIKQLDPAYTGSDYQMPIGVNSLDDECQAYWDGLSITFGLEGTTCANSASVSDIVYHEYAHKVSDDFYLSRGSSFGMLNNAIHEGTSDLPACFIQDEPTFGNGLYGLGTWLRDLSEDRRWPENRSADPSETGMILSGAFWDLRQSLGLAVASQLHHDAKYGLPDDEDDGVAMSEYFIETLVADDDDIDLSNGTPNMTQIIAAFNAHSIGTNFFINIAHTPLTDQTTGGPYPVTAVIQYTGPIGGLDSGSPTMYLSANNRPYAAYPMSPTGNPDEWGAEIPGQSAAIIRYYIRVDDQNGGFKTLPAGAPENTYLFIAGPATTTLSADMESNPGWTAGAVGDNATTGLWVRVDPTSTVAQTEDDHTDGGTMCWVTGNTASSGDPPGLQDVDDGKTTLVTGTFNALSGGTTYPIISYYRWYSNNAGDNPNTDVWQVDISNNGGSTWTNVETTSHTDQSWRRVIFFVKDYVTPTSNMKLRFIASDLGQPSLIEGGVDDFDLIGFVGPVDVPATPRAVPLALAPAAPNPFGLQTTLHYSLPVAGSIDLKVFDLNGREIRTLAGGIQEPGPHTIQWDGRDDRGRPVASGPYFVRLSQNGLRSTQAVVRIR